MAIKNNPKRRENDIVIKELEGELLFYDLITSKAYCLNPTSAAIWNLCDGKSSASAISKQLSKQLKQPVTDDLVWLALDQFKKDNLLSNDQEIEIKFDGLSRREVVRKVGFASMVALPLIYTLLAPTAAMALSACIAYGQSCASGGVCCPQSLCAQVSSGGTVCTCGCTSPGSCLTQTGCPSTSNCNGSKICAP